MSTAVTRKIGDSVFPAIGYGAMGIAAFYGKAQPDEERFKILDAVYEHGVRHWDTANVYLDSEELIGKWCVGSHPLQASYPWLSRFRFKRTGKRDEIFLATKFGLGADSATGSGIDGSPANVHTSIERSLKRLGTDHVDLYYLHRADPRTPIEHTVGAMAELVKAGKVKYLGLSEISAATLRRAHAVHPIAAIEVEYSPFTLDIEDPKIALLQTARELGVQVVAYAPLGRGLLTGKYQSPDDFEEDDFRRKVPRYSKENFPKILRLADGLKKIGEKHGATAGQVSLAWLLAQGEDIIPIPGTTKVKYLEENIAAANVKLTPEDIQGVRKAAEDADATGGTRYPEGSATLLFADTPAL
ncbi:hypothetical protein HWV62_10723 [Athelia sp. TMB]|nr:hypothetical protein HWV62_10723 [Athelia sp. TMB]